MNTVLLDRIATRGLENFISVPGRVDTIHEYYAIADVFVSSSVGEGLPIVLLEAMAAELPVIATDIPGVREVVLDGETGILVPPNTPGSLAVAMQDCRNPKLRRRYGKAGADWVSEAFHIKDTARAYCSLYKSLLGWGEEG